MKASDVIKMLQVFELETAFKDINITKIHIEQVGIFFDYYEYDYSSENDVNSVCTTGKRLRLDRTRGEIHPCRRITNDAQNDFLNETG